MARAQLRKVTLDVLIPDQERMARVLRALVLTTSSTRAGATRQLPRLVAASARQLREGSAPHATQEPAGST